ncbi:hypothetical protein CPC16_009643 [Podila verticillata]|nr:hypothetical protein BGZ52_000974 [Haplosporangium bisporale]KAF9209577.1 hypothetical protein BGZ59_010042 [Podila verticillata]KAF9381873.1 hypothetical protein CPC16_009643 [Podila verticillata]KAI9235928.1 MAG: hypothetical protein BYD32DRAFT_39586 [Podila humilis]
MKATLILVIVTLFNLVHTVLGQAFQNTPGLTVNSPKDGQTVAQDQSLPLAAQFTARRLISSFSVSIAKADGSGNITLAQKSVNTLWVTDNWDVASSHLDLGDYVVQFVVTANRTSAIPPPVVVSSGGAPFTSINVTSTTTTAVLPTGHPSVGVPTVYYWRGTIKIVGPQGKGSDAVGLVHGQSAMLFKRTLLVLGVVALGCVTL